MRAWITATQLVRIQGCQAARAGAAAQLASGPARQAQTPVIPARISFTAGRREAVRAMTQTLCSPGTSPPPSSPRPPTWPAGGSWPACCPSGRPVTGNGALNAASSSPLPRPPGGYPPAPARPPSPSTQPGRSPTPAGTPGPRPVQVDARTPPQTPPNRPGLRKRHARRKPRPACGTGASPGRYPGRCHPRRHSETPRQSHTGIPGSIQLKECLTPKSDGVGATRQARIGPDVRHRW